MLDYVVVEEIDSTEVEDELKVSRYTFVNCSLVRHVSPVKRLEASTDISVRLFCQTVGIV